jgi:hypothetical protein
VDGTKVHNSKGTSAQVPLSAPPATNYVVPVNIAANPKGLGHYPLANATYTYHTDWTYKAIDGYLYYDSVPDNRWTNYQSPFPKDTLQVTFARPRTISSVTLALFSDVARNGAVDVPSVIEVYGSSGLLANTTGPFLANDRNTITFNSVETKFIAVTLYNPAPHYVGICELEVWVTPSTGPTYYAVDALLTDASVTNDIKSTATKNGAVVGGLTTSSIIAFSGIDVGGAKKQTLVVRYSNTGSAAVTMAVQVNQVTVGDVVLKPSGGGYGDASVMVPMAGGKNFVSLVGGSADVKVETISFSG